MITNHRTRITVPTGEDRHPTALTVHTSEALYHVGSPLRMRQEQQRKLSTIDIPHREVHIASASRVRAVGHHRLARGKDRIASIDITDGMRLKSGAVEITIKLVDLCLVAVFHLDCAQLVLPNAVQGETRTKEVPTRKLSAKIAPSAVDTRETCGRLDQHLLSRFHVEGDIGYRVFHATLPERTLKLRHKPTTEAGLLAPPLVDAVHGVVAPDALTGRVHSHKAFAIVAVGIHDDMQLSRLVGHEAEDSGAAGCRYLGHQLLLRQIDTIIIRMAQLIVVIEWCGARLRLQPQRSRHRHERKGTIVLGATAYEPVTGPEALKQRVSIIVRSATLLFRVLCLWCPEVHAMRHEHRGQRLSVLLRSFAIASGRDCRSVVGTHHCVDGACTVHPFLTVEVMLKMTFQRCP